MNRKCTCRIPRNPTVERLRALGMGCTADLVHPYCCPVLDKARRKAQARERTAARLAKLGVSVLL